MKSSIHALLFKLNLIDDSPIHLDQLSGGKQHRTMLVSQHQSNWVVKQLSQTCWLGTYPIDYFEQVENLAHQVKDAIGATIYAFNYNGQIVHQFNGQYYIVLPWVNGKVASIINIEQSYILGRLLAQIHQLKIHLDSFSSFECLTISSDAFKSSYQHLLNQCNQSLDYKSSYFVLSHRDINLSNVIWNEDNKPLIIDWESAGLIHPSIELIGLGLNCAGIEEAIIDWGKLKACFRGYKSIISDVEVDDRLYFQAYYTWFAWLNYCLNQQKASRVNLTNEIDLSYQAIDLLAINQQKISNLLLA